MKIETEKKEVVMREEREKPVVIVRMDGDLDMRGADELIRELMILEDEKSFNIVVDLERVGFICSSGLGVLVATLQKLKKHNGTLKLLNPQKEVMEKLIITKLLREFEYYSSDEDALKSYRHEKK